MSERGEALSSDRERTTIGDHLSVFGFTASIGAHSISDEVAGFSPLCFPRRKFFVSLISCEFFGAF